MKIVIQVFIFLLLFSFQVAAQETPSAYQHQIDSVQTVLNKKSLEDTSRVIAFNHLARLCIYDYQYDSGFEAAIKARTLAKEIKYQHGEAYYLKFLDLLHGDGSSRRGYHILSYWQFDKLKSGQPQYEKLIPMAEDRARRIAALEKASIALEKSREPEYTAHLNHLLAFNYLQNGNVQEAQLCNEKAEKIFIDLKQNIPLLESILLKIDILKASDRSAEIRNQELRIAKLSEDTYDEHQKSLLYFKIGTYYFFKTPQTDLALDYALKGLYVLELIEEKYPSAVFNYTLGATYQFLDFPAKAVEYFNKTHDLIQKGEISEDYAGWYSNYYPFYIQRLAEIGDIKKAEEIYVNSRLKFDWENTRFQNRGAILMAKGEYKEALGNFYTHNETQGIKYGEPSNDSWTNYYIAKCLSELGEFKESNRFAIKSYEQALTINYRKADVKKACLLLYQNYEKLGDISGAFEYLSIYNQLLLNEKEQDIENKASRMAIQAITNRSEQEKADLEQERLRQEQENKNQRWWLFSIAAGLLSSLLLVYLLVKNNKNKQKANALLSEQKETIENTLTNLKSTQKQLIQSEKMASLGELTAGIAHEIQNPLNFVNNFSEVSEEMLGEMDEEIEKGDLNEIKAISSDLKQNLQKINHHGNRASSIVKGMLEHSQSSSGEKVPTDINALADEYLRLAYHGLRAKDKDFQSDFNTEFDKKMPKVNVIPQDIGRVLLNLINNSFQACAERSLIAAKAPQPPEGGQYKPTVTVSIWLSQNSPFGGRGAAFISVTDNGPGISPEIKDKIFQPFFTTKPTGKGTGLGLSLAYDIVKAHGGKLEVVSKEGTGSTFKIILPI